MWIALGALALAADPTVQVSWKGSTTELRVVAAPGEVVNDEAPAAVKVDWGDGAASFEGLGRAFIDGVPLPAIRGAELGGTLDVGLCDDAKTACRFASYAVDGYLGSAKKGTVVLSLVPAPTGGDAHGNHGLGGIGKDAAVAAAEAFKQAASSGDLVMLDFGAVWCPPCNALTAEVLSDEAAVDGFVVATLDVDDRSSFELKHRYAVGGYPTVVVTDAEGNELSRYLGYDGRDRFVGWLDGLRGGVSAPADPASATPEQAAAVAADLARQGKGAEDIQPWLDRADPASEGAVLARVSLDATADDVRWLADHDVDPMLWVWSARGLVAEDDALAASVRASLKRALPRAKGVAAADTLYALAMFTDNDPTLYAASAAVQRALLTGDPVRDKAYLSGLGDVLALAGDEAGAEALLKDALATWPDEPTFYLSLGHLYLDAERPADALDATTKGMAVSWDDNRLRMAALQAKALVALDRQDDAAKLVEQVLAEVPAPPPELAVRAHRYRKALADVVAAP